MRRLLLCALTLLSASAMVGCGRGGYAVETFPEASHSLQECVNLYSQLTVSVDANYYEYSCDGTSDNCCNCTCKISVRFGE
jgi:hypothetical protein